MSAATEIIRRDGGTPDPDRSDGSPTFEIDTALAFMVAPAVPSALVATVAALAVICAGGLASAVFAFWLVFCALAFGGYLSALLIGVPAYLLIRLRGRHIPRAGAMLVGGMVAASPWTVLAIAGREQALFLFASAVFGLGCIGGISFSVIRDGSPRRSRDERQPRPPGDATVAASLAEIAGRPYARADEAEHEAPWSRSGPRGSPTTAG